LCALGPGVDKHNSEGVGCAVGEPGLPPKNPIPSSLFHLHSSQIQSGCFPISGGGPRKGNYPRLSGEVSDVLSTGQADPLASLPRPSPSRVKKSMLWLLGSSEAAFVLAGSPFCSTLLFVSTVRMQPCATFPVGVSQCFPSALPYPAQVSSD